MKTAIGNGLYPKPPDLRAAATQDLTDGELFYIIENGVRFTGMPAFGTGKPDPAGEKQVWQLVYFIRHLPRITPAEIAVDGGPQSLLRCSARRGRCRFGLGSGLVALDQLQLLHPCEVGIERPDQGAVFNGEGTDQEVAEAKSLTVLPGAAHPAIHRRPRVIGRVKNRERCQRTPEPRTIASRRSRQEFDADWNRESNFVSVDQLLEDLGVRARGMA